jgi:hypothetical protein
MGRRHGPDSPDQTETQIRLEVRPGTAIQSTSFRGRRRWRIRVAHGARTVEVQDLGELQRRLRGDGKGEAVEMIVTVEQKVPYEGTFRAQILGLPNGITVDPLPFTKDTTELKFTVNVTPEAPVGKFEGLLVDTIINNGAGEVIHRGGAGALKVYEPLPATLQPPRRRLHRRRRRTCRTRAERRASRPRDPRGDAATVELSTVVQKR